MEDSKKINKQNIQQKYTSYSKAIFFKPQPQPPTKIKPSIPPFRTKAFQPHKLPFYKQNTDRRSSVSSLHSTAPGSLQAKAELSRQEASLGNLFVGKLGRGLGWGIICIYNTPLRDSVCISSNKKAVLSFLPYICAIN